MLYTVATFYRFTMLHDAAASREAFRHAVERLGVCGTLLIAPEGINGAMAGSADAIDTLLSILSAHTGLTRQDVKFSSAYDKPFNRLKIRLKREIITFNQPEADPSQMAGAYIAPQDWNRLLDDPEITVLDTRNLYETAIGRFATAIDPQIEHFTDFASYVRSNLDPAKHKKIAMYCTGGIRCEKASAFMRAEGFDEVYHLQGGILKYLEDVPRSESRWQGDCYVFDKRMAVGHGLTTGTHTMCQSCGYALSKEDVKHRLHEAGVSCLHCYARSSADDKARFRARQRQLTASATRSKHDRVTSDTPSRNDQLRPQPSDGLTET